MNGVQDEVRGDKDNEIALTAVTVTQLLASVKSITLSNDSTLKAIIEKHSLDAGKGRNERMFTLLERLISSSIPAIKMTEQTTYWTQLADSAKKVETKLEELTKQMQQVQLAIPKSLEQLNEKVEKVANEQSKSNETWSQVVSKTKTQVENSTNEVRKVVRESLIEKQKIDERKCNVIVFGLKEPQNKDNDLASFGALCEKELDCTVNFLNCRRLGQRSDNTIRPLLVTCKTETEKRKLLLNAKRLRHSSNDESKKVYINADLSKEERELQKKKREEWKAKRNMTGDKTHIGEKDQKIDQNF